MGFWKERASRAEGHVAAMRSMRTSAVRVMMRLVVRELIRSWTGG